jgi:hypothetical protein
MMGFLHLPKRYMAKALIPRSTYHSFGLLPTYRSSDASSDDDLFVLHLADRATLSIAERSLPVMKGWVHS